MMVDAMQENVQFMFPTDGLYQREGGLRTKGSLKKTQENEPLVSIITVVYNGEKYLEETIQSIVNQTYVNMEYIIIDGGSTDGTLDIIKKYEDKIDYWVSEKDHGISDAFNKGIQYAHGEIVGLINSDDWYDVNAISSAAEVFLSDSSIKVVCGSMNLYTGKKYRILYSKPKLLWFGMMVVHPSTFVKMEIYHSYGLFDTTLKYAMDYDFFLRLYVSSVKFYVYNGMPLSNMRSGGTANSNRIEAYNEVIAIAKQYNFYLVIYCMYSLRKIVWKLKLFILSLFCKEKKC